MRISIIVEGKNDRNRLKQVLSEEVHIVCTYGTPGSKQLHLLHNELQHDEVFIFTDNDASGKKIRSLLGDLFVDATHIYTRRGYHGVEGTPLDYLAIQLEKAGLEEFITYFPNPASNVWQKDEF